MIKAPLLSCLAALAVSAVHGQEVTTSLSDYTDRPAIFKVTPNVVNANVEPFTVTAPAFGNTLKRSGKGSFEPATFRTILYPETDSPDKVVDTSSSGIQFFDLYASGYLDGATVQVYRIINGEVALVREDTVVPGGTVIEHWNTGNSRKVIDPQTTTAEFTWADWSQPESERWFTVFAVDTAGNVSEPATPVKVTRQQKEKGAKQNNKETNFRAKGSDSTPPPAPTNFKASYDAQGVLQMSWDPVVADDLAGYRFARSDTDPASHRGVYLQLANKPSDPDLQIKSTDMIIVSKSLVDYTPDWLSNRVRNLDREVRKYFPTGVPNGFYPDATPGKTWDLKPHPADTAVKNPGEYYFEMTLRAGDTELVGKSGIPDISNTKQEFYPVPTDGAEYIMEVWMKADRADAPPVVFTWDGDERIGGFVGEHPIQVSTEWKKYSVKFTGKSADDGNHAYFVLKAQGPATYAFDNFRVYDAEAEYLDYLPYQYANLERSGMMAYRTHGPIKTGTATYSMRQYLGAPGEAEGVEDGNTLPQALHMMEKAKMYPWLQIEFHMSPEEWLAFAEYIAAPYNPAVDSAKNKPYAALRYEQGRAEPWTDQFERIYFELANETWNGLFRPWVFSSLTDAATGTNYNRGEVYGIFHDHVVDILRSSPYWNDEIDAKFIHVLGGWANPGSDYSDKAVEGSETGDFITIAAYNGGWDEGEGPPQTNAPSYFNVLSQVNQTAIPRAVQYAEMALGYRAQGKDIQLGTYEAGPGYAMNGLNNARVTNEQQAMQEAVMKSKLAGVATLDSFLARAYYDFDLQNFFTFAEGDFWKSHAKKWRGGQPHASYLPMEMFNNLATGDMLETITTSVTTVDTTKSRRREAVDNAPLAAVYAFREGDRVSVICISRKVPNYPIAGDSGDTVFGIELPFNTAESIALFRMTGSPTDTNIDSEKVKVESIAIDPANLRANGQFVISPETGGNAGGLPAAEAYLYVFEGTNIKDGQTIPLDELVKRPTSFHGGQ